MFRPPGRYCKRGRRSDSRKIKNDIDSPTHPDFLQGHLEASGGRAMLQSQRTAAIVQTLRGGTRCDSAWDHRVNTAQKKYLKRRVVRRGQGEAGNLYT